MYTYLYINIYIYIFIHKYIYLPMKARKLILPKLVTKNVSVHSENVFSSHSFQIERNTIVVTVFLLIMNPTEIRLVHNQKENCHYGRIPFSLKGNREIKITIVYITKGFSR